MNGRVHSVVVAVALAALVVGIGAAPAFAAAPTVANVSPTTGPNTAPLMITFTGTGMDTATAATLHKAGQTDIVGTSFGSDSAIQAHATFNITGAVTGLWDVRVTNPDGTGVCSGCFIVTTANPSVSTATPSSRGQGAMNQLIVLAGSNFQNGALVAFSNVGITVDSVNFVSAIELDVTIDVSGTALTGAGNITVTNPDAGSGGCTSCFTVNPKPSIVSSSPSTAPNTDQVTLTLTGTNYEPSGTASLTKTGRTPIAGTNWTRNTANSLSIDFNIVDAAPGAWVINISNGDGGFAQCANCFTVTAAAPTVSSTSPDHKPQGSTSNVSVIGTNFFPGAVASFSGTGITVNSTTFVNTSHVTANITIASNATLGARDVTVTNTDTNSDTCTGCFTVTLPAPTVGSVSPTSGHQGTTINVSVIGSNFVNGAAASFSGTGITVNSTTFVDSSHVTANITIASGATLAARDVTVTNPDTQSGTCTGCFTVLLPAPVVISASPSSATQGATKNVSISGSNFVSGATVTFSGSGIAVNTTTFVDASHITVNITIDPDSAVGARNITVTNPDTQSATCTGCFTVLGHEETEARYTWRTISTTKALGGSYTTEHSAGARASYTFTGTSLQWYTIFGPNQGTASVTIDGSSFGSVNNYRSTTTYLAFWTFSGLSPGTHTIVITVRGVRGSSAGTGTYIAIDAFRAGGGTLQRSPSLVYRWRIGAFSGASGGHYALSDVKGASAYFTFSGTQIDWYAILTSSGGKAAIYIDGVLRGTVDLYRSSPIASRIRISGLTDATHTIKIYVLGTKSAASHGTVVTIDRFVAG